MSNGTHAKEESTRPRGARWLARLAALAALVVAVPLAGAVAAKDTVVVYTAIENEQITDYVKAINKSLPNIEPRILRLSTGDISARFMYPNDFDWSAKNRDRIVTEWSKRYAK